MPNDGYCTSCGTAMATVGVCRHCHSFDENDRLQAEVARLAEALRVTTQQNKALCGDASEYAAERVTLEAENARLQAIVDRLAAAIDNLGNHMFGTPDKAYGKSWRDAKADWWQECVHVVEAAEAAEAKETTDA